MAYNRVNFEGDRSDFDKNATPVFGSGGKNYIDPLFKNTYNNRDTSKAGQILDNVGFNYIKNKAKDQINTWKNNGSSNPWNAGAGSWGGSGSKGSSGGGGGSGGSSNANEEYNGPYAYPDLSAIYQARLESQLNALRTQRDNAIKGYESQISALRPQYQDLRNQSEVERYKAEGKLRNALADRGALDSGAGRTETLNMQTNYGNALNKINAQEQSAVDALQRAIADVNAQYAQQEADARANMYGDLSDWLIGITPMAVNTQGNYDTAKNAIVDGNLANVGSNVGSNYGNSDLTSVPGIGFLLGGNTGLANVDPNNTEAYKLLRNALSKRLLGNALGY